MSMARSVYKVTRTPAFNISVKPVKRRTPRKKEKPFQPSFAVPDPRPDPGWDLETVAIERPSPAPMRRTDPGWELGPPDFEKVDERESFEPAKKRKPKDSAPVASESDEDKWGRL